MYDLEKYLLTKEDSGVSSSELRHMGKQAAVRYVQQETPLNDSVAEFAKKSGLNLEQIKRVSEHANNDTFSTMFKLGFAKNITFPMADASAVSQILQAPKEKTASKKAHVHPRMRYIPGQESIDLESVFTGNVFEKAANTGKVKALLAEGIPLKEAISKAYPDYSSKQIEEASRMYSMDKSAGVDNLYDPNTRDTAKKYLDTHNENRNLKADMGSLGDIFRVKVAALKDLCKEASRSGNSAGIIGYAVEAANPSTGLLGVLSEKLGNFVEFGHGDELQKMGMGMVQGNPITGLTQELEGVSSKLVMAQQAVTRTQMAMQELLSILRGPDMSSPANLVFGGGQPQAAPQMPPQMPPQGEPQMPPQAAQGQQGPGVM
ncbi:MAG: hypothetical protein CL582_21885 [Alteromonadaceae bacterium]|nr:hypothetical protein [Alteromonadaceae bacterium]